MSTLKFTLELWNQHNRTTAGWAKTNIRYKKEKPVSKDATTQSLHLKAWKGEKLSAQWIVSAGKEDLDLSVEVSGLYRRGSNEEIPKENIQTAFVRYVMTDQLNKDGQGGCGHRQIKDFDSSLVADAIDHVPSRFKVPQHTTRPGWISVRIPGKYRKGPIRRRAQDPKQQEYIQNPSFHSLLKQSTGFYQTPRIGSSTSTSGRTLIQPHAITKLPYGVMRILKPWQKITASMPRQEGNRSRQASLIVPGMDKPMIRCIRWFAGQRNWTAAGVSISSSSVVGLNS